MFGGKPKKKRPDRYPEPSDGEWVQPKRRGYRAMCCDCKLVHEMDFRIKDGRVQFTVRCNNRSTGNARRKLSGIRFVRPAR